MASLSLPSIEVSAIFSMWLVKKATFRFSQLSKASTILLKSFFSVIFLVSQQLLKILYIFFFEGVEHIEIDVAEGLETLVWEVRVH